MTIRIDSEDVLRWLSSGEISSGVAEQLLGEPAAEARAKPRPAAAPEILGVAAEPVAVLGTSVRLSGINGNDELWEALLERRDLVGSFPRSRFDLVAGAVGVPSYVDLESCVGSWLDGIEQFDNEAFGISTFDAQMLGPVERLALMLGHEALTSSNIDPSTLAHSRTGVFLAYQPDGGFDYLRLLSDPDERAFLSAIPANAAYRLAYTWDLRGPVVNVDSTCSSSLSALHLARRALQVGDCDLAIVAGISLSMFGFEDDGADHFVRSPRGRCSAYDDRADGIVWGEGGVCVVLSRKADAVRRNAPISAVVAASAMVNDGTSIGMAAPNPDAHRAAVQAALAEAGITPESIGYVEGHGAGTPLGDVVEIDALTRGLDLDPQVASSISLGSIKTVVGHLGDAAGLAGCLAAILRLRYRRLPGLAGLDRPSATVDWASTPLEVHHDERTFPARAGHPRRAAVSSLGLSGTNVHVILEEWVPQWSPDGQGCADLPSVVKLSAPTRWAVWESVRRLRAAIERVPVRLVDVAHTLAMRPEREARVAIEATDLTDLTVKLDRLGEVRAFDRVPDHFPEQGIWVGDCAENRKRIRSHVAGRGMGNPIAAWAAGDENCGDGATISAPDSAGIILPPEPLTTRRIWPESARRPNHTDVDDLFFAADWEPTEPVVSLKARRDGEVALVLVRVGDTLGPEVSQALADVGFEVVVAEVTDQHDRSASGAEVSLADPNSYQELIDRLGERSRRLGAVVHVVRRDEVSASSPSHVRAGQEWGALALFHLGRALAVLDMDAPVDLVVVTEPAHPVVPEDRFDPTRATAFGLSRVLSQENPHVRELSLDHDGHGLASDIAAELLVPPADRIPLVAYRSGKRYRKLVRRREPGTGHALPIRTNGVYVIAGGTGNLGPHVARVLGERGARDVVMLSRSGVPDRTLWDSPGELTEDQARLVEALREAERTGVRVHAVVADVVDCDSLSRAFDHIVATIGPPVGGFMLTKQLFHKWVVDLTVEEYAAGLENRLIGTTAFAHQLARVQSEFLVMFSSISSMSGTKGAAECCGANLFLDSAPAWLSRHVIPAYTINLPLILGDKSDFVARSPIPPIDLSEFREVLRRFLNDAHALDVVARFDPEEVRYLRPVLRIPLSDDVLPNEARPAPDLGSQLPVLADVKGVLRNAWVDTLGSPPEPRTNFFTAGGSSLSAIRFVYLVAKAAPGLRLDVATLYSSPVYDDLVATLHTPDPVDVPAAQDGGGDTGDLDRIIELVARGELEASSAAELLADPAGLESP
ncbi:ketoacyl-synthetase-like protein [Branchiibius hedensis]|uniref:Ketoacyl-synthetase C-terminal extension n=1 Tax=Branchiibius hedensis TaxID=672460 RepID=A0A2Y9C6X6_9MICO|nr:beta-ketoacyl synthase N-terminal-like domain-containing protein [Branchiibius hedensis]PWJ23326.1 ketoacyl-synthetase-like protein [Branchiibius hedensis]SSA59015.1 Ketoacyl-synthetase C-terminal extension [Branchiibius hedensis]